MKQPVANLVEDTTSEEEKQKKGRKHMPVVPNTPNKLRISPSIDHQEEQSLTSCWSAPGSFRFVYDPQEVGRSIWVPSFGGAMHSRDSPGGQETWRSSFAGKRAMIVHRHALRCQ